MKNAKGEDLTIYNLSAHWDEDYHHRLKAGINSDLCVAAAQLNEVLSLEKLRLHTVVSEGIDCVQRIVDRWGTEDLAEAVNMLEDWAVQAAEMVKEL